LVRLWLLLVFHLLSFLPFPLPAPADIDALSLHDALPIFGGLLHERRDELGLDDAYEFETFEGDDGVGLERIRVQNIDRIYAEWRSEEHTSELQSRENLVCRLLLEKTNGTRSSPSPFLLQA